MGLWWLSFSDPSRPKGFLGVAIIETETDPDDPREAMKAVIGLAWAHDCNPGGEVQATKLPIEAMTNEMRVRLARVPRHVLLDRATLESLDLI